MRRPSPLSLFRASFLAFGAAIFFFVPSTRAKMPTIFDIDAIRDPSTLEITVLEDWKPSPKDPAIRQAVIAQLATVPSEAMLIAVAGLESKYLGIRIASWELMKKIYSTPIDYDPWASTKRRNELLKSLNKPAEK